MVTMIHDQKNWHYEWIQRSIERLDERRHHGETSVDMQIGELERLLHELLSMHMRCDRLEDMLQQLALYQIPAPQIITKSEVK